MSAGHALVATERAAGACPPVDGRGDRPPRVGVTVRCVAAGGDADTCVDERAATPQVGVLVVRHLAEVAVTSVEHEAGLRHDDHTEVATAGG